MNNGQFHKNSERLDLFLFKVRLFKSRTLANKACVQKAVLINDQVAKPSFLVKLNDVLTLKHLFQQKKYLVLGFPRRNMTKQEAKELIEVLS